MNFKKAEKKVGLRITENVTEEDVEEIHRELQKYNRLKREASESISLGVFYEEENGQKKAGLTGEMFGNWLCIKYLWVSEELRGRGIGSRLMEAAEKRAVEHGVKYAFVDTFDFQAPQFYISRRYEQVFKLADYPYTGVRYYYVKQLKK